MAASLRRYNLSCPLHLVEGWLGDVEMAPFHDLGSGGEEGKEQGEYVHPSTSASVITMIDGSGVSPRRNHLCLYCAEAVMSVPISGRKHLVKRAFSTFRIFPLRGRIAWNLRSRPVGAAPAESPSTRYSFAHGRILFLAVGQLARQIGYIQDAFSPVSSRARRAVSLARPRLWIFPGYAWLWRDSLPERRRVFVIRIPRNLYL